MQSRIKVSGNSHTKNRKLNIEAVTKMDDCFTIFYKTEEPKNIDISTPISLEVSMFWCETDMFLLDSKRLPLKRIRKDF